MTAGGVALPTALTAPATPEKWQCDLCMRVSQSTRALATHMHPVSMATAKECDLLQQAIPGRYAASCFTPEIVEKNSKCHDIVQPCWPPMPLAIVQETDASDREQEAKLRQGGWRASKAFQPAIQTLLPPARSPEAQLMHAKMSARRLSDELPYI